MQAGYSFSRVEETRESLRFRVGPQIGAGQRAARPAIEPEAGAGGVERAQGEERAYGVEGKGRPDLARLKSLVEKLIEMVTGKRVRIRTAELCPGDSETGEGAEASGNRDTARAGNGARAGWSLEYEYARYEAESETSTFRATGSVRTADGREINFLLDLSMHREYESYESVRLRAGDAAVSDPLVINFDGTSARLSGLRFEFDLDGDGAPEEVPMLESGSGFLVLDLNGNGAVDDGAEMFGPVSGDGFAELASYDLDGNNWIDEGDPVFSGLRVWVRNPGEDSLLSLADTGVGAIYLGRTATPFSLTDSGNQLLGAVRTTGLYLREDGTAGAVQQLDLSI